MALQSSAQEKLSEDYASDSWLLQQQLREQHMAAAQYQRRSEVLEARLSVSERQSKTAYDCNEVSVGAHASGLCLLILSCLPKFRPVIF